MKLSGTRVAVIDDTRSDVENLLRYFDRNSVPYNYFYEDADLNNLPQHPLKGVRVVFLDFVLGTDGASTATKMSTLMNVLSRVIGKDNGPYVIMLWTMHNDQERDGNLVPDFKTRLFNNVDVPNPIAIIDLDKAQTRYDLSIIEEKITHVLSNQNIFEVLFDWEKKGHDAAVHVLDRLQGLAGASIDDVTDLDGYTVAIQEELKRHLYHFSIAVSGKPEKPNKNVLIDAQIPFIAILADNLEQNIRLEQSKNKGLTDSVNAKSLPVFSYSESDCAIMNSYFAISRENVSEPMPGNLYKRSTLIGKLEKDHYIKLDTKDLYDKNRYTQRGTNADWAANYIYLGRKIIPVLFEVTPSCDFAQKNWKGGKFVSGILCPIDLPNGTVRDKKLAGYISSAISNKPGSRIYDSGLYEYNETSYRLILHADYTFTMPLNKLTNKKPLFRAKKELLVAIQHWLAGHASRPGKTEF